MYIIDPNVLHYISDRTQISEQFDLSYLSWLLKTECVGSFSFARSANRRPSHCPITETSNCRKPTHNLYYIIPYVGSRTHTYPLQERDVCIRQTTAGYTIYLPWTSTLPSCLLWFVKVRSLRFERQASSKRPIYKSQNPPAYSPFRGFLHGRYQIQN